MSSVCRHCGGLNPGGEDLVATWRGQCVQEDLVAVRDRVPPTTAARLIGVSLKWLARHRNRGTGPQWSRIPVAGSRVSYELRTLAEFYEAQMQGESWD